MVNNKREILLKLVCLAMGWGSDISLPEDIDWQTILDCALEQGVEAIALDGFDAYFSNNPGIPSPLKNPKTKPIMLAAIGRMNMTEFKNLQHLTALVDIAEIMQKKDIPFMIMKGFACGQYYPNPKHRPSGDIDIYPGNRFDESNKALRDAGVEVDSHYYRHSVSYVKGVMMENHRILADLRGPKKQTRALEAQMEREAAKSILAGKKACVQDTEISLAVFPSADFNALFLPWHVSAHFEFERVTLRHLLDWALFLVKEGNAIDVKMFREAKDKYTYGFSKLADILTNLAVRYLKIPTDNVPSAIIDDALAFDNKLADRVFNYMFVGQPRERDKNVWKFRFNNVKRIWQEKWKYKEVYGLNVIEMLFYKVYGVLFKVGGE